MNLKEIYTKGMKSSEIGYIHYTIGRAVTTPLLWLFIKLKFTPNIITIICAIFRTIGLYCYFAFLAVPAVIFSQIGELLDYSDGAMARITNSYSEFGRFLDVMQDYIVMKFFPVALALGLYFHYKEVYILLIAFILYAFVMLRESVSNMPERSEKQKDTYFGKREEIKSKYSIFSRIFIAIIDFNKVFFPFIILFNLNVIFAFYFFNIVVESLRIIFDYYSTFSGFSKKS